MILLCLERILRFITNINNSCFLKNVIPNAWKISTFFPFAKKKHVERYNELRPISILPLLSKIIKKLMYSWILEHDTQHKILPEHQSGFRKGFGCATALLHVTDDIIQSTDRRLATILVLIDFSKAFDRLDHKLLLSIVHHMSFEDTAVSLMISYFNNRVQYIETHKGVSPQQLKSLVFHKALFWARYYLVFILAIPISKWIKHFLFYLYADDTKLYISFNPDKATAAQSKINENLSSL